MGMPGGGAMGGGRMGMGMGMGPGPGMPIGGRPPAFAAASCAWNAACCKASRQLCCMHASGSKSGMQRGICRQVCSHHTMIEQEVLEHAEYAKYDRDTRQFWYACTASYLGCKGSL